MQFAQICDWVETDDASDGSINSSPLLGTWVNSNPDTKGIARMVMSGSDGDLSLQVYAIGPNGLIDWGTVDVAIFASAASSRVGAGFSCRYDFGFKETVLQGMTAKGLLVLAQFHEFKDDSKRMDYFVREYFALVSDRK